MRRASPSPFFRLLCAAALAAALAGCGSTSGGASGDPGPAEAAARLDALTALDQRVARVAYRLSKANAELCPTVRQSAGWALHAARQYSVELRPHAQARFLLEGDLPGVLATPEGSPAAKAGLRQGDLIVGVNGEKLDGGDSGWAPRFEGLAENVARLDAALARGPVSLSVRRDGETVEVRVTPETACGYEVQLNPSDELNARADGRRLFISTALAGFTETDDELAIVLGHELAHHVLGHRTWSDVGGVGRATNAEAEAVAHGPGGAERQADRVGLYLMARAGYNPAVAAPFWRRFGASNWRVRYPQLQHASAESRATALAAVAAEIEGRRLASEPLIP